jgi:hypothetical protein
MAKRPAEIVLSTACLCIELAYPRTPFELKKCGDVRTNSEGTIPILQRGRKVGGNYMHYTHANNVAAEVKYIEEGRVWVRGTESGGRRVELAAVPSCSPTRFLHLAPIWDPHFTIDQWFARECTKSRQP